MIHRDIKPENILLEEGARPVVADFGIARAIHAAGGERLTETGLAVGTPAYDLPPRAVPHPMLVPAPVEGREGRASSGTRATA